MKLRTYWITFAAFSFSQSLRTLFPLNKDQVKTKYQVGDLFLAIMDVLYFFFYAIGASFYFKLIDRSHARQTYLKFALLGTISGCFFAYFSLFYQGGWFIDESLQDIFKKTILIGNVCIFGFSQFVVWPLNLGMVSVYYKPETDGAMIGFWSSGWQLGSIITLLGSNLLVFGFKVRWQVPVLLFAALNIICSLLIYFFLNDPKRQHEGYSQLQYAEQIKMEMNAQLKQPNSISLNQEQTSKQFLSFIKQLFQSNELIIYLMINGICSAFFFGFFYWLPIYIVELGYKPIAGYITMIYQVFSIIGSFFIGFLHQEHSNNTNSTFLFKAKTFLYRQYPFICNAANLVVMIIWVFIEANILIYGILIALIGFFMGGLFNSMHSNDLFKYTKNDPLRTQMFAVAILITNYLITAVFCLLIGFVIHFTHSWPIYGKQQNHYQGLFYVLIIIALLNMILLFIKKSYEHSPQNQTSEFIKIQEVNTVLQDSRFQKIS